ncbi:MAG: hypothetical protein Q7S06_03360 [Nanoarchaeota archaeon]|nr:hypothetical protein [Nanoarchaeota archaeon]
MAKRKKDINSEESRARRIQLGIYQTKKESCEENNNLYKKGGRLTALVLGTFCGVTSAFMGIVLHSKNQPAQSMLIPAILMGLSYGSIGRIERYYDKKTIEEVQRLKKEYDIN